MSAKFLAGLYVWNNRKKSRDELFDWAAKPLVYEDQIRNSLHFVRLAASQGYDSDAPESKAARLRAQELLRRVIDHSAPALESYRTLGANAQEKKKEEGRKHQKRRLCAVARLSFRARCHNGSLSAPDLRHSR